MTVMDPRPWSPAGPHIGPDDDDLAMLETTGEEEVDLGSAVLAAHRVGAAACEAVARAPLPDEFRLVDALATARMAFAAPAVEAISKCVSNGNPVSYADLLLRDLLDAGEAGALAVYRACVSKGVAPPLAAQRAGLIYGVPQDELGRYMAVAADPKSHPVAIADAADRAVTYWASGVVRSEMSEVVSKATATETVAEYNQTQFGQAHPKGQRGRFVDTMERTTAPVSTPAAGQVAGRPAGFLARLRREGGGGQAAPEVEGAPAPPVTAAVAPPTRVQRTQRVQRVQRTQGAQPVQAKVKTNVRARLRAGVTASLDARLEAQLQAQRNAPTGEGTIYEGSFDEDALRDQFGVIPNIPLAWAAPVNKAKEIYEGLRGSGEPGSPKHTQIGNLQPLLMEPMRWEHSDHEDSLEGIADASSGDELPVAIKITERELEENGISQLLERDELERRIRDYAEMVGYTSQLAREGESGALNPLLKGQLNIVPSAERNRDWYIIKPVEAIVHGDPNPMPMAAEFVVVGDRVRGNIEGGPDARQPYYELDPSQHMVVHSRKTVWRSTGESGSRDPQRGFFIDRYTVEPMDEWREDTHPSEFGMRWVGKADVAVREREVWRTERRNAAGEWTKGGFLARVKQAEAPPETKPVVKPVVTPIRVQRQQRGQRVQQVKAPVQAGVKAQVGAKVAAPVSAELDAKLRAVFAAVKPETPARSEGFPVTLDDRPIHRVLSSREWANFLRKYAPTSYADDVRAIDLPGGARMAFAEASGPLQERTGDEVNRKLRTNVARMIDEDPENRLVELPAFRRTFAPNDHEAMEDLRDELTMYMEAHPEVSQLQFENDRERGPWAVKVYRNLAPVKDQVLIYAEDDIDWDRPVSLIWVGKTSQEHLNQGREYYYDRSNAMNAPVSVYRAEQRVWRARQDEQ